MHFSTKHVNWYQRI